MSSVKLLDIDGARSSVIKTIGYAAIERWLYVEFRTTGDVWRYENVDGDLFTEFVRADSMGRYFAKNIRRKFDEGSVSPVDWDTFLASSRTLTDAERAEAYKAGTAGLFDALRNSPRSVGF